MHVKEHGRAEKSDVAEALKQNHETGAALFSKIAAKLRGRAGRFRGKNGTKENNKARGGKKAR